MFHSQNDALCTRRRYAEPLSQWWCIMCIRKKNLIEFHNGALCTMVHYAQRGEICIRKNYFTAEVFEYPNKIAIPYCIYESAFYRIFERIWILIPDIRIKCSIFFTSLIIRNINFSFKKYFVITDLGNM